MTLVHEIGAAILLAGNPYAVVAVFRPGSPHRFARSINSILGRLLPLGLQLTVGYGDIVLPRNWRMLGPLESIIGALMWGVSVSLLFAAITRLVNREPQSSR